MKVLLKLFAATGLLLVASSAFAQFDQSIRRSTTCSRSTSPTSTMATRRRSRTRALRRPCGAEDVSRQGVGRARGDLQGLEQEPAARVPDQRLQRLPMIELILTKYPNLKSIRDLGGTFTKPGRLFFTLFGRDTTHSTTSSTT